MINIVLAIFLLIISIIIINKLLDIKESFDTFSPYEGNQSYPFVYQKNIDQVNLQKTLKKYEVPFNCMNDGYYNAEPNKLPPLISICSYKYK
jgi:hypothetical protein